MKLKALKQAFPYTIPVLIGYLFLGTSFGVLLTSSGFPIYYAPLMCITTFGGSAQIVGVDLLKSPFNPLNVVIITLLINSRHIFYGISMLDKYKNLGLKKIYMIFGMTDETFSINCNTYPEPGVDVGWFWFFITLLDHIYWISGSLIGALLGSYVKINYKGIEFVMTALFTVIFVDQFENNPNHTPAFLGLGMTFICLFIFGTNHFIIPALILISTALCIIDRNKIFTGDNND